MTTNQMVSYFALVVEGNNNPTKDEIKQRVKQDKKRPA